MLKAVLIQLTRLRRCCHRTYFFIFILNKCFCHLDFFQAFFLHSLKVGGPIFNLELPCN